MTTTFQPPYRVLAILVASFAAALAAFLLLRGAEPSPAPARDGAAAAARPGAGTDAQIAQLQAALRGAPRALSLRTQLADAYLQKARETGDPGFYTRADGLLRGVLAARPGDPDALVGAASLALSRHDFRRGLSLAARAAATQPDALAPLPLLVDAQVELGRFGAAERTLQRLIDAKPALPGYARASYLRELHGDLDGAVAAMRRAVAAGGPAPESLASVQSLLGGLELQRGRPAAALRAQRAALAGVPGFPAAEAGLARLAAARGDLDGVGPALARAGGAAAAAGVRDRPRRGAAGGRARARRAARAGARGRRAATHRRRRERRRGARRVRGRPRRPGARGRARASGPGAPRRGCAPRTPAAGR